MKQKYVRAPFFYAALASILLLGNSYAASHEVAIALPVEGGITQGPSYRPVNEYGSFVIRLDKKSQLTEKEFVDKAQAFFGVNETNAFRLFNSYTDELGKTHNAYQHYVGAYPVEGQMFIVHADRGGKVTSVNGTIVNIENKKSVYSLRANVKKKPIISKEKALQLAFKANKVQKKQDPIQAVETVFVKSNDEEGLFVLAHKVHVDDWDTPRMLNKNVFISVDTGKIVNEVSLIAHAGVTGAGDGHYRSHLPLELTEVNGTYQLVDANRKITTFNAENMTSEEQFYSQEGGLIKSTTTNFPKSPANEIHWGLARTYDYYKEIHNRTSYDGRGSDIYAYYNPLFLDGDPESGFPDNAFASHSQIGSFLVFGRGSGFFNPLTTLDVVGHEFSHLVVGHNGRGGLNYQGESGALNEGFADILGTAIEHYAVADADWLIGKGVVNLPSNNYMRNMQNPKLNHPGSAQPTTYKGEYWANTRSARDNGGVHINSSVLNFWFYLLTEGGSGMTDPVKENNVVISPAKEYSVSGIGFKKAERIAYRLLMTQLWSNAQYTDAVQGALTAAEDLFGPESEEYYAVYDAWYAVGLLEEARENMSVVDFELTEEVFSFYPNPVSQATLTVLIKDEKGTLAFYNMSGQKVTSDFTVERGENKISIPQLAKGTYLVLYESKERKLSEKIVVK